MKLAELIDGCFADTVPDPPEATPWLERLRLVARRCHAIEQTALFNNTITVTIIVVGVFIGIDTDALMACEVKAARSFHTATARALADGGSL